MHLYLAVLLEHPKAVGAGNQHPFDAAFLQDGLEVGKHGLEIIKAAQVVGGLGAAIKDHPEVGDLLLQLTDHVQHPLGPAAGQGAAGKEDGVAPLWDPVPGESPGAPPFFIGEKGLVLAIAALAMAHYLAALGHEEAGRIDILGADRSAEPAEAAVKGDVALWLFEEKLGKAAGAAVCAQEPALLDADGAVHTVICHGAGLVRGAGFHYFQWGD